MTIKEAHKQLDIQFAIAKNNEWVRSPVSYALHKVWRFSDQQDQKEDKKKQQKMDGKEADG